MATASISYVCLSIGPGFTATERRPLPARERKSLCAASPAIFRKVQHTCPSTACRRCAIGHFYLYARFFSDRHLAYRRVVTAIRGTVRLYAPTP